MISAGGLGVGSPADTSGQKITSSRFDISHSKSASEMDKQLALYRTLFRIKHELTKTFSIQNSSQTLPKAT
jgi:hypothetical protein